jgi:hypothetical protein
MPVGLGLVTNRFPALAKTDFRQAPSKGRIALMMSS